MHVLWENRKETNTIETEQRNTAIEEASLETGYAVSNPNNWISLSCRTRTYQFRCECWWMVDVFQSERLCTFQEDVK